ncbi:hypothetical protein BWQ96_08545 [Gracilariopsis chorda]|uniref:Phytanoyl-CoA dioxygenase n=1 Tax=Gracilariopsis chorda TaxID=448386 RepID=A0A2V3II39_9FLOR|nr:hypothetical protein BWQ96_08545 [Gracilariopsis chorda]|eukprot:PXF41756.1 hypothetical protein BWQ96_08545 [Gracilariopsis chorda]
MPVLTEVQKLEFIRDGYVVLPGIVPFDMAGAALYHCDIAYESKKYNLPQNNGNYRPTPSFWHSVKSANPVTDLFYKTDLYQVAEDLLGPSNTVLRKEEGQIAYTLPDEESGLGLDDDHPKNKWHIDTPQGPYANQGTSFILMFGVALSEGQIVDQNRGQLTVWPGSHFRTHKLMREIIQTHPADEVVRKFKSWKPDLGFPKRVLVMPGDGFIVHQRLAHAPGVNKFSKIRKNIYFRLSTKMHDATLPKFNLSPTPWVGYHGLGDLLPKGSTEGDLEGKCDATV